MPKSILLITTALAISALALDMLAQNQQSSAGVSSETASESTTQVVAESGSSEGKQAKIAANTEINAMLESGIDTRKAKPGDEVSAKVTKDVKQDGEVVIHKGDRLLGEVISAKSSGTATSGSQLAVQFDRLQSGEATTELQTVVTSIFRSSAAFNEADTNSPSPMAMPAPQPRGGSGSGGGLLGGVGSTVGSTLGAAGSVGSTAGGVLGASTSSTLGTSADIAGLANIHNIRVESEAAASESGGVNSMLSTPGGDLRLDSGTQLKFRVVGQAN